MLKHLVYIPDSERFYAPDVSHMFYNFTQILKITYLQVMLTLSLSLVVKFSKGFSYDALLTAFRSRYRKEKDRKSLFTFLSLSFKLDSCDTVMVITSLFSYVKKLLNVR